MESPWYIFRAAELVCRHRAFSLTFFPWCRWPKPATRSHAMCSLSSRGAQLFAGGIQAEACMNDWHSSDLEGSSPLGCGTVLGQGAVAFCPIIRLQPVCCLWGRRQQNVFRLQKVSIYRNLCAVWMTDN